MSLAPRRAFLSGVTVALCGALGTLLMSALGLFAALQFPSQRFVAGPYVEQGLAGDDRTRRRPRDGSPPRPLFAGDSLAIWPSHPALGPCR